MQVTFVSAFTLSLGCACLVGAAASLMGDEGPGVVETVRCTEIAFSRAVETRDKEAFARFLDYDTRFVGRTVLRGPDEVLSEWSMFLDNDYPRIVWRPTLIEVLEDGTLALSRGPYLMSTIDEDGKLVESWGTFTSIWRLKEDGNWRIVFDAGNEGSGAVPDDHRRILSGVVVDC